MRETWRRRVDATRALLYAAAFATGADGGAMMQEQAIADAPEEGCR